MIIKKRYVLPVLLGLIAVAGCRKEGPSIAITNPDVVVPHNTVIVLDKATTDWTAGLPWERQSRIVIDRHVKTTSATGLMKVEIAIRNRTDHMLRLDVQTKFFAADGAQVDESATEAIVLRPQETKAYSSSTLRETAEMYRVEIAGAQ